MPDLDSARGDDDGGGDAFAVAVSSPRFRFHRLRHSSGNFRHRHPRSAHFRPHLPGSFARNPRTWSSSACHRTVKCQTNRLYRSLSFFLSHEFFSISFL